MFTQGAALGYVIVGLSARLRPHYQFYRTAIPINIIVHSTLLVQLRQLHPLSKCSNVLVCKVIKKVSYLQSLFVMILQLFSPFASAAQSDSVRRPPHNDGYISPESLPYSPMKAAATI